MAAFFPNKGDMFYVSRTNGDQSWHDYIFVSLGADDRQILGESVLGGGTGPRLSQKNRYLFSPVGPEIQQFIRQQKLQPLEKL